MKMIQKMKGKTPDEGIPSAEMETHSTVSAAPDEDERVPLTIEQVEAMLPDGERVHTFRNPGAGLMFGADWDRSEILEACKEFIPELSGPAATAMNHGIVLIDKSGPLFIETKEP